MVHYVNVCMLQQLGDVGAPAQVQPGHRYPSDAAGFRARRSGDGCASYRGGRCADNALPPCSGGRAVLGLQAPPRATDVLPGCHGGGAGGRPISVAQTAAPRSACRRYIPCGLPARYLLRLHRIHRRQHQKGTFPAPSARLRPTYCSSATPSIGLSGAGPAPTA